MKINFLSFVFLSLFLQVENVNYLKDVQKWVDKVYETIYLVGCWHKQPHPSSFDDIKKKKTISCGWSVSITYQQAGLIEKGKKYLIHLLVVFIMIWKDLKNIMMFLI